MDTGRFKINKRHRQRAAGHTLKKQEQNFFRLKEVLFHVHIFLFSSLLLVKKHGKCEMSSFLFIQVGNVVLFLQNFYIFPVVSKCRFDEVPHRDLRGQNVA